MRPLRFDNLVIGSGFAGAVAALRLGQASAHANIGSVGLLERGRRWLDPSEFPTMLGAQREQRWRSRTHPLATAVWRTDASEAKFPGLLERFRHPTKPDVVCGAAVGGGSVVYGGMMVQPEGRDFELIFGRRNGSNDPHALDPSALANLGLDAHTMHGYYAKVRDELADSVDPRNGQAIAHGWEAGKMGHPHNIYPQLDDVTRRKYLEHFRARLTFRSDAKKAGLGKHLRSMYTLADWQTIRAELEGTATPSAIVGEAVMGFRSGAMLSLDKNYLWRAERDHGVEVVSTTQVDSIHWDEDRREYEVRATYIGDDGLSEEPRVYRARRLFLCAGSMNTSKLLLRAQRESAIPHMVAVGEHWGGNGDYLVRRCTRKPVGVAVDVPSSATAGSGFTGGEWIDDPDFIDDWLAKIFGKYRQGCPPTVSLYFRDETGPLRLIHAAGPTIYRNEITHLSMSIPKTLGRLDLTPAGTLRMHWKRDLDPQKRKKARSTLRSIARASKAKTLLRPPLGGKATFHPLGGMRLGVACDWEGRVRGTDNLFVLDGALFPGHTAACNPAWTIAAVAERCIEYLIDGFERESS